jgi:hypothetical protein
MAAVSDAQILQVLRLKDVSPAQLDPVLDEETAAWENRLEWDFRPSGDLVRRFVRMQALSGFALIAAGRIAGYSYYVCEEHKGLVGDLYVCDEFASPENENRLLGAVLHEMMRMSYVRRIESQLMMLRDAPGRPLPYIQHLRRYPRKFMVIDLARVSELAPGAAGNRVHIDRWNDNRQEEAAQLIAAAYRGHIDSEINDQYRSVPGARRFLMNIVQYPGCGSFHA